MLPQDFVPGPYTVIIDRRKRARQATGNQRLRKIAISFLDEYTRASGKPSKSRIVNTIWRMFVEACPEGGAFVRLGPDDRWYTVRDSVATEKIGYTMRELLGERYRSSSIGKKMVRLQSLETDDASTSARWNYERRRFFNILFWCRIFASVVAMSFHVSQVVPIAYGVKSC